MSGGPEVGSCDGSLLVERDLPHDIILGPISLRGTRSMHWNIEKRNLFAFVIIDEPVLWGKHVVSNPANTYENFTRLAKRLRIF